jgi:SAM-dependent methyltransferase
VSDTYADVDRAADPAGAAAWQEHMATWPAVRAYKRRARELLDGAGPVLDVGCGPGVDLVDLGLHRAVGVDASTTMAAAAAGRGARLCRADAHALPFRDGAFAGVQADRVLQHFHDPVAALAEMARVAAGGGRLVVAEPDQETLVIRVPGVRPGVLDRLKALRRDAGYRNGTLASRAPEHLVRLGLRDVTVDGFPLVIRRPAEAFGLPSWPATWRRQGGFSDEELQEWDRAIRRPQDGFLYLVTVLVVSAVVP